MAAVGPRVIAAIAAGAVAGSSLRYGVSQAIDTAPGTFPWATFSTNASGSFVLGFLVLLFVARFPLARHSRAFLATGLLGGYTTFSAFAVEADLLVRDGRADLAAIYVATTLLVTIAAAWAGATLGRAVAGPAPGAVHS